MSATAYKRVRGEQVALIASKTASSTASSNWKKFSAKVMVADDDATAAPSPYEQFTPGKYKATGSVEGFVGDAEHPQDLPQPGDELKTLSMKTVTEGKDMLFALTTEKCGPIVVLEVNYDQDAKPSTWSFTWRSGGILPPVISQGGGGGG